MKSLNILLTIEDVVNNGDVYTLSFEEENLLPPERRSQMKIPCSMFRNIGAPRRGMKFRLEQTENGSFFYLDGKLLGSPKTRLSLPAEEQAKILERQRQAEARVAKAKKRKERLALA